MNRTRWSLLVGVAASALIGCQRGGAIAAEMPATASEATKVCGPNSLYVFLRLIGLGIHPGDTDKYYPKHPQGMSMLELKRACGDFGVAARVVRCETRHLDEMALPAIARVSYGLEAEADHYVVITRRIEPGRIETIDGTTGGLRTVAIERFGNVWDGHLLVLDGPEATQAAAPWAAALLAWGAATMLARRLGLARRDRVGSASKSFASLGLALAWSASPVGEARGDVAPSTVEGRGEPAIWRSPANDGLNCLFLQVKCLGYRGSYREFHDQFVDAGVREDLGSLASASRRIGYGLVPTRLNLHELESLGRPTLVHLEKQGEDRGYYALFLNSEARTVFLFHGGKATIEGMSRDQFRREWTGIGLVQAGDGGSLPIVPGLAFAATGLGLGLVTRRARRIPLPGWFSRSSLARVTRSATLAIVAPVVFAGPASAAEDPRLDPSLEATLRENASRLSPLTVKFAWGYRTTVGRKEALRRIKMENRDPEQFFHDVKFEVSWQDGKYYRRREMPSGQAGKLELGLLEDSTDGRLIYAGTRGGVQPIFFKRYLAKVAESEPASEYLKDPYFSMAGYHIPEVSEWDAPRAEADVLYRLRIGGRLESVATEFEGGRKLTVIRLVGDDPDQKFHKSIDLDKEREILKFSRETPERQEELIRRLEDRVAASGRRRFTYRLDPSLRDAIVAWEIETLSGDLIRRASCEQFAKVGGRDLWLPELCRVEIFQYYLNSKEFFKESFLSEEARVESIDPATLPPARFTLAYEDPGTIVNDATLEGTAKKKDRNGYVSYTIPAQARHLEEVIRRAQRGEPMVTYLSPPIRDDPGRWYLSMPFILVNSIGLVAATFAFLAARKRRLA